MLLPFINKLVDTTACAAMSGQRQSQAIVSSVITAGKEATYHGLCIPLPPLLDVAAILNAPYYITKIPNRYGTGALTQTVLEYDIWLREFCRHIQKLLGKKSQADILNYLPLLLDAWGKLEKSTSDDNLFKWTMAYDKEMFAKTRDIHDKWLQKTRKISVQEWWWWKANKTPARKLALNTTGLLTRFSSKFGARWANETFDHDAANLYLNAKALERLPEHEKRLKQIRKKKNLVKETLPYTEFPETQHPYYGNVTLIKLALLEGEDGDYDFSNGNLVRFANHQPESNPPELLVYLSYICGYESITHKNQERSYASFLQAIIGLILDDWLIMAKGLRVRFHLHRGSPHQAAVVELDKTKKNGQLPPIDLVGTLFKRHTYADVCQTLTWQLENESRSSYWYCGCALTCDLIELGFKSVKGNQDVNDESSWIVKNSAALPKPLSHIIIVDDELKGGIYKIRRRLHHLELSPVPNRYNMPNAPAFDQSFISLRYQALGLLLSVLDKELG